MKAITQILFLFLHQYTLAQSTKQATYSVKAFLPYWNNTGVRLTLDDALVHNDTIRNDMYGYTGTIAGVKRGTLELKKGNITLFVPLFVEGGTIKIRDKGHNRLEAYGTQTNNTYLQVQRTFDSLCLVTGQENTASVKAYKRSLAAEFIKKNPQSPVSLQLIRDYYYLDTKGEDSSYYSLAFLLSDGLKETALGKKLTEDATVRYRTTAGAYLPSVSFLDTALKNTALRLGTSYTLVSFWGSWCLPCRREHPTLINLYKKYNAEGFEIISVSLDTNALLWKEAMTKDKLLWQQVSDLRGWNGRSAKTYGVKRIPTNFLLDKSGVIVEKDISLDKLEKKLKTLTTPQLKMF